jgi:SAM-dependent methyltransferase
MNRQSFVQNGAQKYNGGRSSLFGWLSTPQGAYVLDWELGQFDSAVEDVFGFRAVQVGLPEVDFLRQNRIPYRFSLALEPGAALAADPLQMPLAAQSVDLVAPHAVVRAAARVLMPEGQIVISGFNPASLWRFHSPGDVKLIGLFRLREWLRVLGFELNGGKFGLYVPAFRQKRWIERFAFMEKAGARWWPIAGALYVVRAVKRVHGMRLVTPAWRQERARRRAVAAVTQRSHRNSQQKTNG